jgi:hypothetical protein
MSDALFEVVFENMCGWCCKPNQIKGKMQRNAIRLSLLSYLQISPNVC